MAGLPQVCHRRHKGLPADLYAAVSSPFDGRHGSGGGPRFPGMPGAPGMPSGMGGLMATMAGLAGAHPEVEVGKPVKMGKKMTKMRRLIAIRKPCGHKENKHVVILLSTFSNIKENVKSQRKNPKH